MPADHHDVAQVLQRIADALLRLLSDRADLLRVEAREEIDRLLVLGARLLLWAAACAVGLVLVAIAAADLLAPLLPSRPLRYLVLGAPLFGVGAWRALLLCRAAAAAGDEDGPAD